MPAEIAVAYVSLVPSARGLSQAIHKELVGPTGQVAGDAGHAAGTNFGNRFTSAVSTIAKAGALGLAAVGVVATKLVIDAIGAAEESRKIAAQTTAVIQSTGAVANVSARQVSELVDALSAKAGVDDELIQSGANVLLTFTKVRNEVGAGNDIFNQATAVALDMSVALGQDLQSSVTQIGKALNDPIAGLTALTRVGVQFTDQQKEQIKTLVESGDVLGAQKVILAELTTQFGGSAEAQATATGRLKVAFDNVSEAIGGVLLPYVDEFATWMLEEGVPLLQDKLVPAVADLAEWIKTGLVPAIRDEFLPRLLDVGTFIRDDVLPALGSMWAVFRDDLLPVLTDVATFIRDELVPPLRDLKDALFGVNDEASDSGPSLGGWAAALAAVGVGAAFVASKLAFLAPVIKGIGLAFAQAIAVVTYVAQLFAAVVVQGLLLSPLYKAVAAFWFFRDEIGAAFTWIYQHAILPIGRAFEDLWGVIIRAVGSIVSFVGDHWQLLLGILTRPIGLAVLAITTLWDTIYGVISAAVGAVIGFVSDHWPQLLLILTGPIGIAAAVITQVWETIKAVFVAGWQAVAAIWSATWDAVTTRLNEWWDTAYAFFTALPGNIAGFFASAGSWLVEGGRNIMRGLWNGVTEVWNQLTVWVSGIGGVIVGYFWNAINWLWESGRNVIHGLWNGLKSVWGDVVAWFQGIPSAVLSALGIASPPQWAIDAGKFVLEGIVKGLGLGVGSVMDFMSGLASKFTGPLRSAWDLFTGGGDFGALKDMARGATGLTAVTAAAKGLFHDMFPGMTIGGWRAQGSVPGSDHPKGKALDLMTGSESVAQQIISVFRQLAGAKYWIWNRAIATAESGWQPRRYSGPSPHTDHVHLSFYKAGGVVPADELAFLHRGETVFTPDQMRVLGSVIGAGMDGTLAGGGTGRPVVEQNFYGVTDPGEIIRRGTEEWAWTMRVAG
jgi:phage-related protein